MKLWELDGTEEQTDKTELTSEQEDYILLRRDE